MFPRRWVLHLPDVFGGGLRLQGCRSGFPFLSDGQIQVQSSDSSIGVRPDTGAGSDRGTLRSLEWLNFFVADVQTGLGPFIAAYLASAGWNAALVCYALTFAGLVTFAMQTPAGAIGDAAR